MNRTFKMFAALALIAAPVAAQSNANAPVVTVLAFDNASFGKDRADYEGIGKGIMDIMIVDMAAGSKVRVVDRERVQKLLEEQNLTRSGAIDANTAIRVGNLLGACYSIYGTFIRQPNGQIMLTVHTTSNETGQIQNAQKIEGKDDNVMGVIAEASTKFINGMNVSACRGNAGAARGGNAPAPAAQQQSAPAPAAKKDSVQQYSKTFTDTERAQWDKMRKDVKLDARTTLIYSRALDAKDRKDNARARQLAQQVVDKYPAFTPAKDLLQSVSAGN